MGHTEKRRPEWRANFFLVIFATHCEISNSPYLNLFPRDVEVAIQPKQALEIADIATKWIKCPLLAMSVNVDANGKSSVSTKLNDHFTLTGTGTDADAETDILKITMDANRTLPISMRNRFRLHF